MKKFAVFSGFLGAGKTTTMMALNRYCTKKYGKAAMISNDLGGAGLADDRFARLSGCDASELTGNCICYQTENLVARLDALFDAKGCTLVTSDIPGFGVGALEHVYHTLNEQYTGRFELAPFTVLTEPETVRRLKTGQGGELEYILKTQLVEADLIVLNKADLLTADEQEELLRYLRANYARAQSIAISALTGQGLDELCLALLRGSASLRRPDIGYGGEAFSRAMGRMSEYNTQYYAAVCCNTFDGNAYLDALAAAIQTQIRDAGCEIPHLKLLAWEPEGDYGKADLLGIGRPVEQTKKFARPCTELAVILNTSAVCPAKTLDGIITGAIERVSGQYQLSVVTHKKECFAALGE